MILKDLKKDFPIFGNNPGLVFLDNAASTQKPALVIDGVKEFLSNDYANIHRGFYSLSERSEAQYDRSKEEVAKMLGGKPSEIFYTYNSTYGFNLLALSLARSGILKKGDKILLSIAEHHANIVPWLILKQDYGVELDYINITDDYDLDFDDFAKRYDESVKLVSLTWASNVTGTIFDLKRLGNMLRDDTIYVIDGSQAVPNFKIDVNEIGCDFLIFTGHKMMAQTGIGVVWANKETLKSLSPGMGGGGSIKVVEKFEVEFQNGVAGFEPGTPNIVGAVSLLKALEYVEIIGGFEEVFAREQALTEYALTKFNERKDKIEVIGTLDHKKRLGVFSFIPKSDLNPLRLGEKMAEHNICIRCGGHCAHPFLKDQQLKGTCRMSLYFYNDFTDIDRFFEVLDGLI